jgi:hypothetical protein
MKSRFQFAHGLLAGAALAGLMGSTSAHAFPAFQVHEGAISGTPANTVVSDRMSYAYGAKIAQVVTGGDGLAGSGDVFREAGYISISSYANGAGNLSAYLNGVGTAGYKLYATFLITGETNPGTNGNLINAGFQNVSLTLYADVNSNTSLGTSGTTYSGATAVNVTRSGASDDVVLGTAGLFEGEANIYNGLAAGDFGVDLLLSLTTAGQNLFNVPSTFYKYMRVEGTTGRPTNGLGLLNGGNSSLSGGGTITFSNYPSSQVPEPDSALLLGGGLLAVYATSRRRGKKA